MPRHGYDCCSGRCDANGWHISILLFEWIRLHDIRVAKLLSLMAMPDGQQIPQDLLQKLGEREVDFRSALGTLDSYSLVTAIEDYKWTMHALAQLSVQDWLAATQQKTNAADEALRLVAGQFPIAEHENRATCKMLLPRAWAVLLHATGLDPCIKNCSILLQILGVSNGDRKGTYKLGEVPKKRTTYAWHRTCISRQVRAGEGCTDKYSG